MAMFRVVENIDFSVFQGQRPLLEVSKDYIVAVMDDKSYVVLAKAVRKKPKKEKPQALPTPEAPTAPGEL